MSDETNGMLISGEMTMNETVQQTLADTLDYLMALVQDGIRPEEASSGLRPLQKQHPAVGIQLVWEEESFDHSMHYDALLHLPGKGTVSLSYCDDRAMPWPLRGVHRWSDADLVRVNNNVLTVDQAIACLDFIWEEARITDRLVNVCLIQAELDRDPIEVSDQELQLAMDGFRRARKLYKTEDTHRWMERRGLTHPELERLVSSDATVAKLRDKLVADQVQNYFDANPGDFDTAYIARFLLPDEARAQETLERLRRGDTDFFDAAQCSFMAARHSRRADSHLFRAVRRREVPAEIGALLFESNPGSVVGPVREEEGYAIIRVLSTVPAILDDGTRDTIKKVLFEEWLENCRHAAAIEWLWGTASKTAQITR